MVLGVKEPEILIRAVGVPSQVRHKGYSSELAVITLAHLGRYVH